MKRAIRFIKTFTVITLILAMIPPVYLNAQEEQSKLVAEHDPQFAVDWMQTLYDEIQAQGISAPAASRLYGYAGVTLYESLLNGMPGNISMSFQLNDMPEMPYPRDNQVYDWPTVAITAMNIVLSDLLPEATTFDALHESQIATRQEENSQAVMASSERYGKTMADALLDWIAGDNFAETREAPYELPTGAPNLWVRTIEGAPIAEPYWGEIRPFVLSYADECEIPLNITFDTDPDSTFYAQGMEVMFTEMDLTPDQRTIAEFWVDTPGMTGTPAGHWVMIENQLIEQLDLTLDRAAEIYAMMGVTVADSFISCWSTKYRYLLLRPESYIKTYIRRSWVPYIQSPMFPSYPSGHSVVSVAAADMLTYMLGTIAFTDNTHTERGLPPREFTSFTAAANEAAISRLYGGIHYRFDIENGIIQGHCVAARIIEEIRLRPLGQGE